MFALFEEAGKFQAGRVLSEAESSAQVELDSGKRVKVKAANILLKFEKPAPAELMREAQALAQTIELELAWEFAPQEEFGFADLARDYFSEKATLAQQAAALLRLFEAPHYFRRAGKGRFKKAPAEILQQALAAIEKKKQVQAQIAAWAAELAAGTCPRADPRAAVQDPVQAGQERPRIQGGRRSFARHAHRPAGPAQTRRRDRLALTSSTGSASCSRTSPRAPPFPPLQAPAIKDELPLADVQAFSIDDSSTTEIDDALSVQGLGIGHGDGGHPHRGAGPGAAAGRASSTRWRRQRLSTVYMPGYKITMLPDDVVQAYTLLEGRDCPAVSLYATFDEATLALKDTQTRLERVPIGPNLRHDQLDAVVTEAWLRGARRSEPRLRRSCRRLHAAAVLPVPARPAPEVAARGGARQARKLQPARLQLPPAWATTAPNPPATSRCRSASASAARRWT